MARDPLLSSEKQVFFLATPEGKRKRFEVWVKLYKSGRTRVLLPHGYEVASITNNGILTDDLTVELLPRKKEGVKG
jgi:hypothetical protein